MANSDSGKRKSLTGAKVLLIFFLALCVSLIVAGGLFWASHRICYKYNDWWIKGSSIEDVKEKYGTSNLFQDQISESRNENAVEVYCYIFDGYFSGIGPMSMGYHDLYVMKVDDTGTVIDVYYRQARGG